MDTDNRKPDLFESLGLDHASMLAEARQTSDKWLEENRDRLTAEAMARSDKFAEKHARALARVNVEALRVVKPRRVSLLPKERLFLWYINGKTTDMSGVAGYWTHDYGLNYQAILTKLFTGGYLQFPPLEDGMTKYSLKELQAFLADKGLKKSGTKQTLIRRIVDNTPENEFREHFSKTFFQATDKGTTEIQNSEHIIYAHQHRNDLAISIDEIEKAHQLSPEISPGNLALVILDSNAERISENSPLGALRNSLYIRSAVLHKLGRLDEQLDMLFQVCILDMSQDDPQLNFLAPGIVHDIHSIISVQSMSLDSATEAFCAAAQEVERKIPGIDAAGIWLKLREAIGRFAAGGGQEI